MKFQRHYRLAAAGYQPPDGNVTAAEGKHLAELAERELRDQLLRGELPKVQLVTPERATLEDAHPGGRICGPVFAWSAGADWADSWIHAPHVVAELWAANSEPDPACDRYAAHGSVRLANARITSLHVSPWLAPVADQLRDTYGVEVCVATGDDTPAPEVAPAPVAMIPAAFTASEVEELWQFLARQTFDLDARLHPSAGALLDSDSGGFPAPDWAHDRVMAIFDALAQIYSLPVTSVYATVVDYGAGEHFPEHVDNGPEIASSMDRTLSFTLMLSTPGVDFTGGELLVNGEPVELQPGDVAGFTAKTPHEVLPVESGERVVLVAFGEVER